MHTNTRNNTSNAGARMNLLSFAFVIRIIEELDDSLLDIQQSDKVAVLSIRRKGKLFIPRSYFLLNFPRFHSSNTPKKNSLLPLHNSVHGMEIFYRVEARENSVLGTKKIVQIYIYNRGRNAGETRKVSTEVTRFPKINEAHLNTKDDGFHYG